MVAAAVRHNLLLLALAAAITLTAPATAQAGWRIERATRIARIVWHHPCVDQMTIRWAPVSDDDASAWATIPDCTAWLDQDEPLEWEPFCTLVLHEAGHLAGAPHSDHGIMTAENLVVKSTARIAGHKKPQVRWIGTDRRCADRGRPYLRAHTGVGTLK